MISAMSALFRATRTRDFDRLYRRHAPSVYRYAFAVLGNHVDAEDVTQQTFMNAYRAFEQGTKPRKAENWLLTIAHNEVRRHFRNTHMRAFEVELDERLPHPAQERPEPSLADVLRALQHLPPTQREALVMREFEGRSYREIRQIMNLSQGALEGLIFRARRSLAEHLEGAPTCDEAEQAVLRRLDRRLPRREARRLKAHLRECSLCVLFAEKQKRQRALLKGLSVMPIPASLFLFRGEPADRCHRARRRRCNGRRVHGARPRRSRWDRDRRRVRRQGGRRRSDRRRCRRRELRRRDGSRRRGEGQAEGPACYGRRAYPCGRTRTRRQGGARPRRSARPRSAGGGASEDQDPAKAKVTRTRPTQVRAHEVTKAWKVHPVRRDVTVKSRPTKSEVKPAPARTRKRPEVGKKVGRANTKEPKPRPNLLDPARAAEKSKPSHAAHPTPPAEPSGRAQKR